MKHNGGIPSIGFLSTYPPTSCGLATFAASLREAVADVRGSDHGLGVVSLADGQREVLKPEVVYEHLNGDRASLVGSIEALNSFDAVFAQHELHTVLSRPSPSQRTILEKVVDLAERTIVMTDTANRRLVDGYLVDPTKVRVVPHGARVSLGGPSLAAGTRPVVLTWGLIGPGKGLEMAIDAFAGLQDLDPLPRYVILGKTHPKVQAAQGDAYIESLVARVHDLGLDDVVEFDGRYLDSEALSMAVRQADLVLLPYESTEQVTSGVLVEAIAAGKPVIATAFPHAIELLGTDAGIVVPHGDPIAMTAALRKVFTDPALAASMAVEARQIGSTLHWPIIARRYHHMATKLVNRRQAAGAGTTDKRPPKALDAFAKVG
jgi:glycosyltransferase involved in cell wall biosynthesis